MQCPQLDRAQWIIQSHVSAPRRVRGRQVVLGMGGPVLEREQRVILVYMATSRYNGASRFRRHMRGP